MDSDRPPDNARPPSVSLTMVATLASELRNQLAVIVTSIDTIRRAIPPGPEIERVLAELDRAIDGGFRVSYEMVAMVQPPVAEPAVADLNEVVSQTRYVIERLVGEHVTVWINLTPFDTVVRAASIDVEWLLLNLASNAADAMPGGGLLTIETDLIRIPFNVPGERWTRETILWSTDRHGHGWRYDSAGAGQGGRTVFLYQIGGVRTGFDKRRADRTEGSVDISGLR